MLTTSTNLLIIHMYCIHNTEEVKIIKQPKSQLVSVGGTVTLRCKATGCPAPQNQWVKDGAELPDGINKELTLDPVTLYDSGNYFCLVSNHVNAENRDAVDFYFSDSLLNFKFVVANVIPLLPFPGTLL